jgi:hypothetical protein
MAQRNYVTIQIYFLQKNMNQAQQGTVYPDLLFCLYKTVSHIVFTNTRDMHLEIREWHLTLLNRKILNEYYPGINNDVIS